MSVKELGGQQTIANIITNLAISVAEQAESVSERVCAKLGSVMISDKPIPANLCKAAESPREYPPLFEELRNKLQSTETALIRIENALSRTEL